MFDSVKFWLSQLNPATGIHSTKYHFLHDLKKHCELLGNSPDELVRERKEDLKSDDERVRHTAEVNLKTFMNYLREKGLAPNTRENYFTSIRSFYKRNYLELQFFRNGRPKGSTAKEGAKAATKEDIRKMLEVSSPRVRALILFIKDTGIAER